MSEWFKSSKSGPWTDNFVEIKCDGDMILMRDSKDHDGPVLTFNQDEWNAFVLGAKDGEFDL